MFSRRTQILLAFATVYVVWGSTYLAIRVAVLQLPPFLMAGLRFDIAGALVLIYALASGARLPSRWIDWRNIAIPAFMMLIGGNGLVSWSEQWVESNLAALIAATSALWMGALGALGSRGEPMRRLTMCGLVLGFAGVVVLVGGGLSHRAAPPLAYAALLIASALWAGGSIFSRRHPVACKPAMTAALQMCVGGIAMTLFGLAMGDGARWSWQSEGIVALAYLIVFGSCIGYGAYFWLVHEVTPASLGTYAYVNPAVAVLLGWLMLNERLSVAQMCGTGVILAGVILVTLSAHRASARTASA